MDAVSNALHFRRFFFTFSSFFLYYSLNSLVFVSFRFATGRREGFAAVSEITETTSPDAHGPHAHAKRHGDERGHGTTVDPHTPHG